MHSSALLLFKRTSGLAFALFISIAQASLAFKHIFRHMYEYIRTFAKLGNLKMMLRNRDLNVQKNVDARTQQHKGTGQQNAAPIGKGGNKLPALAVPHQKRQAAHLVKTGESSSGSDKDMKDEPRPKRACSQTEKENNNTVGNTVVPVTAFSRSLLIDSTKKELGAGGAIRAAPIVGRKRTSALLTTRDSNVGETKLSPSQEEEKLENEQKMEQDEEQQPPPNQELFNFDKENERDMAAMSQYAQDIFLYYKYRERSFQVGDYIRAGKHPEITSEVRAKLVDWMVELQETFELNHETLYLAVKLVDMFLNRTTNTVLCTQMQLVASAAIFVASKFDERAPPLIDDFIYLAEDSFSREQILEMERVMLKVVDFDLGAPLSYRFLRRYARVCKLDMGTLTLARYVLETSLMFMDYCRVSESRIAAAALLLALRMKGIGDWGPILDKYTGFKRSEIESLMWRLNRMVAERKQHYPDLDTVFRKYSHEIFFEVAKIKLLRE